jgi:hypothetical protein
MSRITIGSSNLPGASSTSRISPSSESIGVYGEVRVRRVGSRGAYGAYGESRLVFRGARSARGMSDLLYGLQTCDYEDHMPLGRIRRYGDMRCGGDERNESERHRGAELKMGGAARLKTRLAA